MLLRPGHDVTPTRRGLVEAAGFAMLLIGAGACLLRDGDDRARLVVFGWPLIVFYWLARWRGGAGVAAAMLAIVPLAIFFIGLGALGGAPAYFAVFPFLPLAAVAVAFIAESRFAQ